MSPTIDRHKGMRFSFYSNEGLRPHVHVAKGNGEAKFWLTPEVLLARNRGMRRSDLEAAQRHIEANLDTYLQEWEKHFGG